jgi:hypothetical protein
MNFCLGRVHTTPLACQVRVMESLPFGITETTSIACLQKLPRLEGKHERGSDTEMETAIRFDDLPDTEQ